MLQCATVAWLAYTCLAAQQEPRITDYTSGKKRESLSTVFEGCGEESCGCGLPRDLIKGVPVVALNVQNTGLVDDKLPRPIEDPEIVGTFYNGCAACACA